MHRNFMRASSKKVLEIELVNIHNEECETYALCAFAIRFVVCA